MPIDYRLPALRRRRLHIAIRAANQQEVIDAAKLDDKSAPVYAMQIHEAQAELDELEFVISFFEHFDGDKPKIPIHTQTIIAAFILWAAVTIAAYAIFAR